MQKTILQQLNEIETKENINIIYAVEAGSRAYGLHSSQSDYDVRFIYLRPLDFYLKLEETKDTLEYPISNHLDINGWDLKKTLRLLYGSNPTVFEWFQSPIIYKETDLSQKLNKISNNYFTPQKTLYHYYGIAKRNYKEYFQKETVEIKKYLYILRAILACDYILQNQTPPPILFSELQKQLPKNLLPESEKLILTKTNEPNIKNVQKVKILDEYIEYQLENILKEIYKLPKRNTNKYDQLNELFTESVKEYNTYL